MYRAIIVDDDSWALKDIRRCFAFSSFGFALIAECMSAEEAIPIILREQPHLVITDICMDKENGLSMIKSCRESHVQALFVILSGHEDFDFAREAMRQGAFHYMLKPIVSAEAKEIMQRAYLHLSGKCDTDTVLSTNKDSFDKLLQYVNENYTRPLGISDLADAFFMNKTYISELFRKRINMTFVEYKTEIRLEAAKSLLAVSDKLIGDIAIDTGFEDMRYFSRVFKQKMGITPQHYREKHRQ